MKVPNITVGNLFLKQLQIAAKKIADETPDDVVVVMNERTASILKKDYLEKHDIGGVKLLLIPYAKDGEAYIMRSSEAEKVKKYYESR